MLEINKMETFFFFCIKPMWDSQKKVQSQIVSILRKVYFLFFDILHRFLRFSKNIHFFKK